MDGSDLRPNPFPGLRPFEPDEDYLFFGREEEIDELLRRLRQSRFLAVVGGSGSGKSSLVRAGLIPSLHSGFMAGAGSSWRVAVMRPGERPFGNLADALDSEEALPREDDADGTHWITLETALRRGPSGLADAAREAGLPPGSNLLVVVDQFEELFRYLRHRGPGAREEAISFVKRLLHAREQEELPIYVALTLRSEYIGDSLDYPGLPEAINEGLYLVPRLTRAQMRLAITGPVAVGGAKISPRLVSTLLNAVGDDPLKLPVLQHALMRTWEHWVEHAEPGTPLDLGHYEAIGALDQALSRHADEAFDELDTESRRRIAESLFRALTDKSTDPLGVRRPTTLAVLSSIAGAPEAELVEVIDRFRAPRRSFLLPPAGVALDGGSVVDISHESLMRSWRRLVEWSDDERRSGEMFRRLDAAARLFERGEAALWRDPELAMALEWRQTRRPTADWASGYGGDLDRALGFLEASRRARDRARRTLRTVVAAGLAAVLLAASAIFWLGRKAEHNARQLNASSILIAARSAPDPALRALLAAEIDPDLEPAGGIAHLREIVNGLVVPRSVLRGHDGPLTAAAFTPDGQRLATASRDGTIRLWAADGTGEPLVLAHGSAVTALAFDAGASRWVTGDADGRVRLWPADSAGEPLLLVGHRGPVSAIAVAPDGSSLATASEDGSVRLWAADGRTLATVEHGDWVRSVAYSPDGATLLSAGADGTARLVAVGGDSPPRLLRHPARVAAAVFSADGSQVLSGADDGVARLWPADGGTPTTFGGQGGAIVALAASSDGRWLATASADGRARVWPADGGAEPAVLEHGAGLIAVAFSPDAGQLLTAASDGTAALWSAGDWRMAAALRGHLGPVNAAAFSADGGLVVSASEDGTARLWTTTGADEPRILLGHAGSVTSARFQPGDGGQVASGSVDRTARLWDGGGNTVAVLEHDGWVRSVAFDPQGAQLVTAADDGAVRRWRLQEPATAEVVGHHANAARSAVFDQEGERIASASDDATAVVWVAGEAVRTLRHPAGVVSVAFGREGSLLTLAADGKLRLWQAGSDDGPRELALDGGKASSARLDASGRRVIAGSDDGAARISEVSGGGTARRLVGHEAAVTDAALSADGELAATASADRTARVWSTARREPVDLLAHEARVNSVDFHPDGRRLVTGAADGTVRIWRIGWHDLLDYLRRSTNACLTIDQRVSYLGEARPRAARAWSECRQRHGRDARPIDLRPS